MRNVDRPRRGAPRVALAAAMAIAGLSAGLSAADAQTEPPATSTTITPGVLVVESIDGEASQQIDLDQAVARFAYQRPSDEPGPDEPGPDGPADGDEAVPVDADEAEPVDDSIRLCFGSSTPPEVQAVANRATARWAEQLRSSGPVIEIDLYWVPFGSPRSLGAAGPGSFVEDTRLPIAETRYPVALANQILQEDFAPREPCDLSRDPEILLLLNATAGGDGRLWHLGEGEPAAEQFDLESVLLHELAHGLGFIASPDLAGEVLAWPADGDVPFVYDRFGAVCAVETVAGCTSLEPLSVGDVGPLTEGAVWFDLLGDVDVELYAPPTWDRGSSITHLDEQRHQHAMGLMTPFLDYGETQRQIDNATLAVLQQLGYPLVTAPGDLQSVSARAGDGHITVDVTLAPLETGVPPLAFDLEVTDEAGAVTRMLVGSTTATVSGLVNGRSYTVAIRGGNAAGQTPWLTTSTPVTPLALPPFATVEDFLSVAGPIVQTTPLTEAQNANLVARARVIGAPAVLAELFDGPLPSIQQTIDQLYRRLLLRQPEASGFSFWTSVADSGASSAAIARFFAASIEFSAGRQLDNAELVDAVYERVLLRSPDPAGRYFWIAQLANGLDRGAFVLFLTESTEVGAESADDARQDVLAFDLLGRFPTEEERQTWRQLDRDGGTTAVITEILTTVLDG